MIRRSNIHL